MTKPAIILAVLGLAAAAAPAANASTVSFDGNGTLIVSSGPERNRIGLQQPGAEDGRIVVYEGVPGAVVTSTSPACEPQGEYAVVCSWSPGAGARVDLGDGDDSGYVGFGLQTDATFAFAGGPGNDDLQSAPDGQPTTLDGGPGDDDLTGGPGTNALMGGDGNDNLEGYAGADQLQGGAGDDVLAGDGNWGKYADVIDGGPGTDRIESDWGDGTADPGAVSFTLAGGNDDGRAGEGDDIRSVERVVSTSTGRLVGGDAPEYLEVFQVLGSSELIGNGGNDTLKASDGADKVDGGAGDDDLDAGFGDDTVVGGPGRDNIAADRRGGDCGPLWCKLPYGNDTVDARDGEQDSVSCGAGQDAVRADAVDVVAADCESVSRDDARPGPGPGPRPRGALAAAVSTTKLSKALARGLKVSVTAPAAGKLTGSAKAGGKKVAAGSRSVRNAGKTSVVLRFTKKARKALRRKGSVKLAVSVRFAPKRGKAVTQKLAVKLKR